MSTCSHCGRPSPGYEREHLGCGVRAREISYVVVQHAYYGCDSGCCGHRVTAYDQGDNEIEREFSFDHPDGVEHQEWALEYARDQFGPHVALRWSECEIIDD